MMEKDSIKNKNDVNPSFRKEMKRGRVRRSCLKRYNGLRISDRAGAKRLDIRTDLRSIMGLYTKSNRDKQKGGWYATIRNRGQG